MSFSGSAGGTRKRSDAHEVLVIDKQNNIRVLYPPPHEAARGRRNRQDAQMRPSDSLNSLAVPTSSWDGGHTASSSSSLDLRSSKNTVSCEYRGSSGDVHKLTDPKGNDGRDSSKGRGSSGDVHKITDPKGIDGRDSSKGRGTSGLSVAAIDLPGSSKEEFILHSSSDEGQQIEGSQATVTSVKIAIEEGRWARAHSLLNELEPANADWCGTLKTEDIERTKRIGARYEESLNELIPQEDGSWTEEHEDINGLDFFFRLSNGTFQVVSSEIYNGFDAFQAFVGLCEFDLSSNYNKSVNSTEMLLDDGTDGVWRVLKKGHGCKEDNIIHASCLDALDEPVGALWFSTYTPSEACLGTTPKPKPLDGALRVEYWRCVYAITPLQTQDGSAVPSFKMTYALCRRVSSAAFTFSNVMKREVGNILEEFKVFLNTCPDLEWRSVFSSKAQFYDSVWRHLVKRMPLPVAPTAAPAQKYSRVPFSTFSSHIPQDWADYVEPCYVEQY